MVAFVQLRMSVLFIGSMFSARPTYAQSHLSQLFLLRPVLLRPVLLRPVPLGPIQLGQSLFLLRPVLLRPVLLRRSLISPGPKKTEIGKKTIGVGAISVVRVCVKASPAEGQRRFHRNTAYARLSGFNRREFGCFGV